MTNAEAIETLKANYPDACYEQLREAVDAAIEALNAQNATGDTISRQAAIAAFKPYALYDSNRTNAEWVRRIELVLEELPSAEKHGKWITVEYNDGTVRTECSVCGYGRGLPPVRHYCPNCGARMDGE